MKKTDSVRYRLAPEWQIRAEAGKLLISGGADVTYEIELEESDGKFFLSPPMRSGFTRDSLSVADSRILEQLLTAEVVRPRLNKRRPARIRLLGDTQAIDISTEDVVVVDAEPADLVLLIRAKHSYATFLTRVNYQDIDMPHLFVDLAFHHTISIGPLVFPGETACVACLQGRISTRWGDDDPPPKPRVTTDLRDLTQALIATELRRIAEDDTSLVGHTVSWNVQDRGVKKDLLLKVPLCPICRQNSLDGDGALALPWSKHENPADAV